MYQRHLLNDAGFIVRLNGFDETQYLFLQGPDSLAIHMELSRMCIDDKTIIDLSIIAHNQSFNLYCEQHILDTRDIPFTIENNVELYVQCRICGKIVPLTVFGQHEKTIAYICGMCHYLTLIHRDKVYTSTSSPLRS